MTIRNCLERNVAVNPAGTALIWKERLGWYRRTWQELGERVRRLSDGYGGRFGLVPGEENVALICGNSPAWLECYLAQAGAGVAVVPVDPKLREGELEYILNDSGAVVVTTDASHLRTLVELAPKIPRLRGIVVVGGPVAPNRRVGGAEVVSVDDLMACGGTGWCDAHVARENDVASIIYTSGTTGRPKGAMLTHANFVADATGAVSTFRVELTQRDRFLVVLPYFHAFSFLSNFIVPFLFGCEIAFAESLRTIGRDLRELSPTGLFTVPLLAEKLYARIRDGLAESRFTRTLMAIGLRGPVAHVVQRQLGGRLRFIVTGGAPCPHPVIECFRRLHIDFLEGYGLTECAPVVSVADAGCRRVGTIGRPCKGVEVKLADVDASGVGELLVRGPNVMKGYYHNEEATREALKDGWLATGDLVSVDEDGYMTIRGRKKALIVNREGKNIYPEEVENAIASDAAVQDVVVVGYTLAGETGERVGALVHPDLSWFSQQGLMTGTDWAEVERQTVKRVRESMAGLADYKHARKIVVSREPLERTAVGKIRRVAYQGALDEPSA